MVSVRDLRNSRYGWLPLASKINGEAPDGWILINCPRCGVPCYATPEYRNSLGMGTVDVGLCEKCSDILSRV